MDPARFLRRALRANALFSFGCGTLALADAGRVAAWLGFPVVASGAIGALLVGYGAVLGLLSSRRRVASAPAVVATFLDLAWVLGSAALPILHATPSIAALLVQAFLVLLLALLQLEGLRRALFAGRRTGTFSMEREVAASSQEAWRVVSDVAAYAEVAGTLHRSEIVSGSGLGMVRECEDEGGACWTERCTRWEPGSGYAFEVDTRAPGYPLPLESMRGDFEVEARGRDRCTVRIRFTLRPRGGWRTELVLAVLFALRGGALVGGILRRWAARIEASRRGASAAPRLPGRLVG